MQSTGNKSMRAAAFVFVCLLAALITGIILYFAYAGNTTTAVPLLIGCVLIAFLLAVTAIRVSVSYRRSLRLERDNHVVPSRLLRSLELRQWLILTVGIAFLAIATGAGTGLRIMSADSPATTPAAAAPTVDPPTPTAIEPTTEPPTTDPTDTAEPTATTDPTDTATDNADPTDTPAETPATKYLDNEPALDGGYDANAVSFSAQRYPRAIEFGCSEPAYSKLQWNVAGYSHFTAVAGIDDATTDAYGSLVEFIFYDQDGHQLNKPIDVSQGHPHKVSLDLKGVVSLRMTCSSRDSKSNQERDTRSSLGDPIITQ